MTRFLRGSEISDYSRITHYSGTPPYDHPVYKTTSLLRPYSFKTNVKTIESFYYFEDPVNATTSLLRPGFYGPTVVALTGFHCTKEVVCQSHLLNVKNDVTGSSAGTAYRSLWCLLVILRKKKQCTY